MVLLPLFLAGVGALHLRVYLLQKDMMTNMVSWISRYRVKKSSLKQFRTVANCEAQRRFTLDSPQMWPKMFPKIFQLPEIRNQCLQFFLIMYRFGIQRWYT